MKQGQSMGSDAIALNFLKKLDFGRIRFSKWHDVINSNYWFLAMFKRVSGLPLFKLIFFF